MARPARLLTIPYSKREGITARSVGELPGITARSVGELPPLRHAKAHFLL